MLARMRKSMDEKDQGFTLIELLVVMIIIGILAAIAIPVFLSQRKKAQDSAAKADVSTLGKEIATYYVDGTGSDALSKPVISISGGRYLLNVPAVVATGEAAIVNQDLGKASANVKINNQFYTDGTAWCISVTNPQGDKAVTGMKYSSAGGLVVGAVCTDANG
jgi:type IV pilus assembly protein PilA